MGLGMAGDLGGQRWPPAPRAPAREATGGGRSPVTTPPPTRADRWRVTALLTPIRLSPSFAAVAVLGQLATATALTYALGGPGIVPPHIFYVPVLFAGIRYGVAGAVAVGLASGLLVGPAMPLDVDRGTVQPLSDWLSRAGFFAGIGAIAAFVFQHSIVAMRGEVDDLRAEHELLDAVQSGQLSVHYQPIISLDTGRIVGAEALVRWEHPTRGLLAPAAFLPFARERHLLRYIRQTVLSQACRHAAMWCRELGDGADFRISVNLDAGELANPLLLEEVAGALAANGLAPDRLCLEITETGLIEDLEQSIESLLALRLLRVGIAVDDFGTGYASLEYAHSLPVDEIKIDRAFITSLGRDASTTAVARSVVHLAAELDRDTVAEGVETAEQLAALLALGCDRAQGFYFSEALPSAQFGELLRRAPSWPHRAPAVTQPAV